MKVMIKLRKMSYVCFVAWMTLFSSTSFGSSMSQFGGGRPLFVFAPCNSTIAGYARQSPSTSQIIGYLSLYATSTGSTVQVCISNNGFDVYTDSASGWYDSAYFSSSNCYSSGIRFCVFKNNNF